MMLISRKTRFSTLTAIITSLALLLASCSHEGNPPCSPTDPSCGGTPPVAPSSRTLSIAAIPQQTQLWCWAATSEMIFRYYGRPVTQCQLVSAYLNRPCCTGDPACIVGSGNMETIQQGLFLLGGIRSIHVGPITFGQIVTEISAGRPIMVGYRNSFAGHVVLVTGYNTANNFVHVLDPFYGTFDVPYGATFAYGGQYIWSDSLVGISP
jgi:hypothetical protein